MPTARKITAATLRALPPRAQVRVTRTLVIEGDAQAVRAQLAHTGNWLTEGDKKPIQDASAWYLEAPRQIEELRED